MLLMVSTLLSLTVLGFLYSEKRKSIRYVVLFSLLSGFGLATKATFLPLVIIPLVLLSGYKRKTFYLAGTLFTFVFFTSPAIPEYHNMFRWFYRLSTHSGIYGHGEQGIIDPEVYLQDITTIIRVNPVLSAVLAASLAIVTVGFIRFRKRSADRDILLKVLFAFILAMVLSILLVAKHYNANHYLIPVLGTLGLILFLMEKNLREFIQHGQVSQWLAPVILTGLTLFILIRLVPNLKQADYYYRITNEEYDSTFAMIDRQYPDHTRIYYYPNSINKFSALKFGNSYAKRRNLSEIKKIYPVTYFYDTRSWLFYNWEAEMSFEDLLRIYGDNLVFISRRISAEEVKTIRQMGFPVREVYYGRTQAVYELDSGQVASRLLLLNQPPRKRIFCNADTLSDDGQSFKSGPYLFFGGSLQTRERSFSGESAIKLDKEHAFGMDIALPAVMEGDRFRISVWRFGEQFTGHLVATTTRPELYYKSANDYIQMDPGGWKQIVLYVTIPPGFGNEPLKVYLWNSGSDPVYFDDLEIIKQ
jgi:hypothetical protein